MALGATDMMHLGQRNPCILVNAQACDAEVFHYKDNTDVEVDAVVEVADGRWAAFEIKLGTGVAYSSSDGVSVIPIGVLGP